MSLLFVFDIDETLIQYIPAKYNHIWNEKRHLFHKNSYVEKKKKNGISDVIIFRPHLENFFNIIKKNPEFFKVALWTYSERDYCDAIADILIEHYHLPTNFFIFKKGAEDINDEDDYPKNLQTVFEEYPQFNVFNTILIDDRYANIRHSVNQENGLLIQPFAPFGVEKTRELFPDEYVLEQLNDRVFIDIIPIVLAIKKDIEGCDAEEFEEGFRSEPVFSERRIKRMELEKYYQSYAIKPRSIDNIISIGTPYLTKDFVMVKGSVALYGNAERIYTKGKRSKTRSKRASKSKSHTSRTRTKRGKSA